jgi:hypothetical protein
MYNNAKRTLRKLQRFISTLILLYLLHNNCYITRYARAYQGPRDVICDYEWDAVRWFKISQLRECDVSDAVRTLLV